MYTPTLPNPAKLFEGKWREELVMTVGLSDEIRTTPKDEASVIELNFIAANNNGSYTYTSCGTQHIYGFFNPVPLQECYFLVDGFSVTFKTKVNLPGHTDLVSLQHHCRYQADDTVKCRIEASEKLFKREQERQLFSRTRFYYVRE